MLLAVAPTSRELGDVRDSGVCRTATVGIGARSAEALTALIREHHPALVLSLGFAGALQPSIRSGSLTLHETVIAPDDRMPPLTSDGAMLQTVRAALPADGMAVQEGPLLTVDRVLLTPAAKHAHGAASGAIAVDMEGYWLARAAAEAGVPMLAVRAVLDEVGHGLPPLVDAIISDGGRNEWRHALRSLRAPRSAATLVPLAVRSRRAGRSLRAATRVLVPVLTSFIQTATIQTATIQAATQAARQ